MSIKLYLPDRLRFSIAKGRHLLEVNGKTVGECLEELLSLIPGINESLFYDTEKKTLHPHFKVLVNEESADTGIMAKEVKDGDEIHIRMRSY